MTRQHRIRSVVRPLRLFADRFAAAAALHHPGLLLYLRAAQMHGERRSA